MIAKITRQGRVTIPKRIRDTLKLQNGDKIAFRINIHNNVLLIPIKSSMKDLKGFLPKSKSAITPEDMQKAIEDHKI